MMAMSFLSPRESLRSLTVPAVLVVLVLASAMGMRSCFKAGYAESAASAMVSQGRAEASSEELAQAVAERDQAKSERVKIEAENAQLKLKLAARPMPKPKPVPPPADQAVELQSAGVATPLPPAEALIVWKWKAQAEELAPVKARLAAAEDLLAGQTRENQALRLELEASTKALTKAALVRADLQSQVKALNAQIAAAVKIEKVGTVEKVAEVALVAVASFYGGRASK
jgi:hypothetical protein